MYTRYMYMECPFEDLKLHSPHVLFDNTSQTDARLLTSRMFFKLFKLYFHNFSRSTNVDSIDIYIHNNNIHIINGHPEKTLHINI